jgi:hypothetical protein
MTEIKRGAEHRLVEDHLVEQWKAQGFEIVRKVKDDVKKPPDKKEG